jgi:hypothetical protein
MAGSVRVVLKSVFDDKGIKAAQSEFGKIGADIGKAMAAVGAVVAVAGAATLKFGIDAIKAAEGVATANARLAQINNSMGLFGDETQAVTNRLIKFAEANELTVAVDAEVIKATQAKLLTFKSLGQTADEAGGAFDRATLAAIDLAAAGFGSAETNAVQLGKALQDPIKGLTALGRAGVTFTAQEKENIKVLVESGKTLEAQNLILKAIETQVGGTAAATANSSVKMKLAFENIYEAVGAALLPSFDELTNVVVKDLTPVLTDLAEEIGPFLVNTMKLVTEVIKQASDASTPLGKSLKGVQDAFSTLVSVLNGGKSQVEGTTDTLGMFADILSFIITTIAGLIAFFKTFGTALDALAKGDLQTFFKWLRSDPIEFLENQDAVRTALTQTREQFNNTADSARRLNNVSLDKLRGQMGDLTQDGKKLANQQRELYYAMKGLPVPGATTTTTTTTTTPKTGGKTAAQIRAEQVEAAEKAFEKVQKLVRATQKKIVDAQSNYDKAVTKANADYLDSVAKLRTDYAQKLEGIIQQSQDRLRGAFASAATFGLAEAFEASNKSRKEASDAVTKAVAETVKAREKVAEAEKKFRQATTDSQRKSAAEQIEETKQELAKIVAAEKASREQLKELTSKSSAEVLVESLRNKLIASRNLISSAAALASEGFSQTFIEQIVSAGTETGNELAAAILNSTPETKNELKSLFTALEQTGETGMDALAKTIYEQQGLATRELRNLYAKTGEELDKALLDQQIKFQETLKAAAETLGEKLRDIKADFEEDVAELKGAYGGLKPVIDGVTKSLDSMIGKADEAAKAASEAAIKAANATRAAIGDITGKPASPTDLGMGATSGGSGSGRSAAFGDPQTIARMRALQAAGEALGMYSQEFVDMVLGQRSSVENGIRTVTNDPSRLGKMLVDGVLESIDPQGGRLGLALALAEQIYGVDIGGISTPGQIGGNTFNISVNAGMGTDPISVGAAIVDAIKRYERSSGQVFASV